jgi:hypothetical protein
MVLCWYWYFWNVLCVQWIERNFKILGTRVVVCISLLQMVWYVL